MVENRNGAKEDIVAKMKLLADLFYKSTYGAAYFACQDSEIAKDATQQAFLIAQEKLYELRDADKVRVWLAKIAMNQARDFLKQRKPYVFTDNIEQFNTPVETVENIVVLREQIEVLKGIVRKLSPQNQLMYYLKFVEEKSDSEIARMLDVPQGTIKSRISRLRQAIKVAMDREYNKIHLNMAKGSESYGHFQ